jgi:uncharacterized protein (UPF0335 family)
MNNQNIVLGERYNRQSRRHMQLSFKERNLFNALRSKIRPSVTERYYYTYDHLRKPMLRRAIKRLGHDDIITRNDLLCFKLAGMVKFTIKNLKNTIRQINIENYTSPSIKLTGNKETLTERLENYYDIAPDIERMTRLFRNVINMLRKFKKKGKTNSWVLDIKPYVNRDLCTNDDDPIMCEELKDIDDDYYYVLKEGKYYYGFDIRTIFSIILLGRKDENPLTRKRFSRIVYHDSMTMFTRLKMMDKQIFFDDEENEIVQEPNTREQYETHNNRVANNISCNLYEFGYDIQEQDLLELSRTEVDRAYMAIFNIWNYNMSQEFRERFNTNQEIDIISMNAFNSLSYYRASNTLLKIYEQFINLPFRQDDKKMGALYVMISLTNSSEAILNRFPFLQNVFDN